jgi:hypothetical protein
MDFSIKSALTLGLLATVASFQAKASEIVYAPAFCEPRLLQLTVFNQTNQHQAFWTQVRSGDDILEELYELNPKEQIVVKGSNFLNTSSAFSVKFWSKNSLRIQASCSGYSSFPLNQTTSPKVEHWLPGPGKTIKLHITNLFIKNNIVSLKALNSVGAVVEEKQVVIDKYYDTQILKWKLPASASHVAVEAEERIHSIVFYEENNLEKASPGVSLNPVPLTVDASKTYFLVSTKDAQPTESFVIALDNPQMINTAREQIRNKDLEKIVIGGIELGNGGFNRAFSAKDKSPYSWSVYRVDAFADFAHIDCDGTPDLTEERLLKKLNEGGRICFWRYRVVRELSPTEVSSGKLIP